MSKPMIEVRMRATSKSGDPAQEVRLRQWYPNIVLQTDTQWPLTEKLWKAVQDVSADAMVEGGLADPRKPKAKKSK